MHPAMILDRPDGGSERGRPAGHAAGGPLCAAAFGVLGELRGEAVPAGDRRRSSGGAHPGPARRCLRTRTVRRGEPERSESRGPGSLTRSVKPRLIGPRTTRTRSISSPRIHTHPPASPSVRAARWTPSLASALRSVRQLVTGVRDLDAQPPLAPARRRLSATISASPSVCGRARWWPSRRPSGPPNRPARDRSSRAAVPAPAAAPLEIRSGSACAMVRTLRRGAASGRALSRRSTRTAIKSSSRRSASGPVV